MYNLFAGPEVFPFNQDFFASSQEPGLPKLEPLYWLG
jgi:hypothetical protein